MSVMRQPGTDPGVTELLPDVKQGDQRAARLLYEMVYRDLRRQAVRFGAGKDPALTSPTELVHDAMVRVINEKSEPKGRAHFVRLTVIAMDRLAKDLRRRHWATLKRIRPDKQEPWKTSAVAVSSTDTDILDLLFNMEELREVSPAAAEVLECLFLTGLTWEETGRALGIRRHRVESLRHLGLNWLRERMAPTKS